MLKNNEAYRKCLLNLKKRMIKEAGKKAPTNENTNHRW